MLFHDGRTIRVHALKLKLASFNGILHTLMEDVVEDQIAKRRKTEACAQLKVTIRVAYMLEYWQLDRWGPRVYLYTVSCWWPNPTHACMGTPVVGPCFMHGHWLVTLSHPCDVPIAGGRGVRGLDGGAQAHLPRR